MAGNLTARQRAFVDAYSGNATQAAIVAGYSTRTARAIGRENLTKPDIVKAIQEREEARRNVLIMNREERMALLTMIARNANEGTKERIRAVDVLNKMSGEYLEHMEVKQDSVWVCKWQD